MDFYTGAVQGQNANSDDAFSLELEENITEDALFRPPIRASIDAVPLSETTFIKFAPLHSGLQHEKKGFEEAAIINHHVAALDREIGFDSFELSIGEGHALIVLRP